MDDRRDSDAPAAKAPTRLWTYRRLFSVGGAAGEVVLVASMEGLDSRLIVGGRELACDSTPLKGLEAARNHRLVAMLPDGRRIDVEAGYYNWLSTAIAVRIDGLLVHESHPGRRIAYPERARKMLEELEERERSGKGADPAVNLGKLGANRVPIAVDIALGLLFFAVAKATDLQTAALVGAGAGIALVVAQRFVKVDLLGGLALFGILMLLVSAGLAILYGDDDMIKQRSTIVGLIGAICFLSDGLFLDGGRLGAGMSRYIAYDDIDPRRLALAFGVIGILMAGLNYAVAMLASTDAWLFYSTFFDFLIVFGLAIAGVQFARVKRTR